MKIGHFQSRKRALFAEVQKVGGGALAPNAPPVPRPLFGVQNGTCCVLVFVLNLKGKLTTYIMITFKPIFCSMLLNNPRANGAKRRSGRKPGARVTNSALAFTYIRIMRCYIAQWHSGIKSRPIFWIWTLDGFRCYAHARVSSS